MPQQINLIDLSLRPVVQRLPALTLLLCMGAATGLLASHFAWEKWSLARALAQAVVPLPAATETAADNSAPNPAATRLAQREALRDLLRHQVSVAEGSAELIGDVIRTLPPTLWLTELEVGPARALRISGAVADSSVFGQFTSQLERIPALKSLPLHTVRLEPRVVDAADATEGQASPAGQQFVLVSGAAEDAAPAAHVASATGAKP